MATMQVWTNTALLLALALGTSSVGCDGADSKAETTTSPAPPASDAPAAALACQTSIEVRGAVSFEGPKVSHAVAVVDKQDSQWISVQTNAATHPDHPYILVFFAPAKGSGEQPFYNVDQAMNGLSLTLLSGESYDAFATHKRGKSAGTFTMSQPEEGWVKVDGTATLSDAEGKEIEVELHLSTAISPASCPRG